jgi:hypothetical protein
MYRDHQAARQSWLLCRTPTSWMVRHIPRLVSVLSVLALAACALPSLSMLLPLPLPQPRPQLHSSNLGQRMKRNRSWCRSSRKAGVSEDPNRLGWTDVTTREQCSPSFADPPPLPYRPLPVRPTSSMLILRHGSILPDGRCRRCVPCFRHLSRLGWPAGALQVGRTVEHRNGPNPRPHLASLTRKRTPSSLSGREACSTESVMYRGPALDVDSSGRTIGREHN